MGTAEEAPIQRARRCEACGGLNPPDAQWCGQCHTRFESLERPSDVPALVPEAADEAPSPVADQMPARLPAEITPGGTDAFTVTEEGITWTCSVCETVNPLDHALCSVCDAPFAKTVLPEEERPQRDPNMAALVSLFMPGAGHAYVGLWGQAVARAIVSLWVIMVVFVAALQRGVAGSNLVMGVFGVVAVGLWGIAAHDAYREANDESALVILKGKFFFYMVLGLLLLLVGLLMMALMKAQNG